MDYPSLGRSLWNAFERDELHDKAEWTFLNEWKSHYPKITKVFEKIILERPFDEWISEFA